MDKKGPGTYSSKLVEFCDGGCENRGKDNGEAYKGKAMSTAFSAQLENHVSIPIVNDTLTILTYLYFCQCECISKISSQCGCVTSGVYFVCYTCLNSGLIYLLHCDSYYHTRMKNSQPETGSRTL